MREWGDKSEEHFLQKIALLQQFALGKIVRVCLLSDLFWKFLGKKTQTSS